MRKIGFLFYFLVFSNVILFAQHKINTDVFGMATSNTFTYFNVHDTTFMHKVLDMKPNILRFPGGAVGNFYHYNKAAYGFDLDEIDRWHKGGFPKRARGLLKYSQRMKHNHNYIEDFIYLAKKTNSSVILVANIITGDTNELFSMIDYMRAEQLDIIGIELGSELSNRPYYLAGFDIYDYIELSEFFAESIKKRYSDIKIGVVAAPLVAQKNHRHTLWNRTLQKKNFYDAVILHSYAKVTKGKSQYGQMIQEVTEGKDIVEMFSLYRHRALKYFSDVYPKEISQYRNIFHKPFWITEWNLQISRITGNTLLQGLFVASYFLELSTNTELQTIELTTFHNLAGRDVSGSIFMNDGKKTHVHPTFLPIKILSNVFQSKDYFAFKTQETQMCYRYDFRQNKNQRCDFSFFINWSDKPIQISIDSAKDQLFSSEEYFGENLFVLASEKESIKYLKKDYLTGDTLTIKPFSLTKITYL